METSNCISPIKEKINLCPFRKTSFPEEFLPCYGNDCRAYVNVNEENDGYCAMIFKTDSTELEWQE